MYTLAASGALLAWPIFRQLDALDGGGREIHLPSWARMRGVRRGHPVWVTIRKELRIQQLTFVMAGLFVAGETLRLLLTRTDVIGADDGVVEVLAPVYFGIMALVAGSLASAEERRYGVSEAQLLLPMSAARQWTIKVAVTLGVALLLGLGLPLMMFYGLWDADLKHAIPVVVTSSLVITVLVSCGLYVSSLSSNAVRALVLAGPFTIGLQLLFAAALDRLPLRGTAIYMVAIALGLLLVVMARTIGGPIGAGSELSGS
jgi:hypothetical protein